MAKNEINTDIKVDKIAGADTAIDRINKNNQKAQRRAQQASTAKIPAVTPLGPSNKGRRNMKSNGASPTFGPGNVNSSLSSNSNNLALLHKGGNRVHVKTGGVGGVPPTSNSNLFSTNLTHSSRNKGNTSTSGTGNVVSGTGNVASGTGNVGGVPPKPNWNSIFGFNKDGSSKYKPNNFADQYPYTEEPKYKTYEKKTFGAADRAEMREAIPSAENFKKGIWREAKNSWMENNYNKDDAKREALYSTGNKRLYDKNHIDTDKLTPEQQKHNEELTRQLKNGYITQEQYDKDLEHSWAELHGGKNHAIAKAVGRGVASAFGEVFAPRTTGFIKNKINQDDAKSMNQAQQYYSLVNKKANKLGTEYANDVQKDYKDSLYAERKQKVADDRAKWEKDRRAQYAKENEEGQKKVDAENKMAKEQWNAENQEAVGNRIQAANDMSAEKQRMKEEFTQGTYSINNYKKAYNNYMNLKKAMEEAYREAISSRDSTSNVAYKKAKVAAYQASQELSKFREEVRKRLGPKYYDEYIKYAEYKADQRKK